MVLFSATYTDAVMDSVDKFVAEYQSFRIPTQSLKLKGVKMFRISVTPAEKITFIKDAYLEFETSQTMVFVNKKVDGQNLKQQLTS